MRKNKHTQKNQWNQNGFIANVLHTTEKIWFASLEFSTLSRTLFCWKWNERIKTICILSCKWYSISLSPGPRFNQLAVATFLRSLSKRNGFYSRWCDLILIEISLTKFVHKIAKRVLDHAFLSAIPDNDNTYSTCIHKHTNTSVSKYDIIQLCYDQMHTHKHSHKRKANREGKE